MIWFTGAFFQRGSIELSGLFMRLTAIAYVPYERRTGVKREAGEIPARTRHCDRERVPLPLGSREGGTKR